MVEVVDGVLQVLEEALVALALVRHIGHCPQRSVGRAFVERPDAQPVPGGFAQADERAGQSDLLDGARARPGGLRQSIDCLGDLGSPGEKAFDRTQFAVFAAAQRFVGFVGVKDALLGVGDDQPVAAVVGNRLGGVKTSGAIRKLERAERVSQQSEHADDRERCDRHRNGMATIVAGQPDERRHRRHQRDQQQQQQAGVGGALNAVGRGRVLRRRH